MCRILWHKYKCKDKNESDFRLNKFLKNSLFFSELNTESVAKILYIFKDNINIYIGDSILLDEEKTCTTKGIMFYDTLEHRWVNDYDFNKEIKNMLHHNNLRVINDLKIIIDKYVKKHLEPIIQEELF